MNMMNSIQSKEEDRKTDNYLGNQLSIIWTLKRICMPSMLINLTHQRLN